MQDDPSAKEIHCPRCDNRIRKKSCSVAFSLGLAIAALIMFIPAMSLPILTFELGNDAQQSTMLSALYYFFYDGYPELSALVFLTTVLAPFVQIIVSILLYFPLSRNIKPKQMKTYFKILHHTRHWVMLDIYVIALLVAYIKLSTISELLYGAGIVMFVFLMFFSFLLRYCFSATTLWKAYHDAH
jgi:paraquat-inducible protein A